MISTSEKKEEYREIKPYYTSRFKKYLNQVIKVCLRNGYSKTSPTIVCKMLITIGKGKEKWGAKPNQEYYVLKVQHIY